MQKILSKALGDDLGINVTNMVLMLLSVILAFVIPFQLFLFVYAVLGPLHYLTEISWLDKKNFFVQRKLDIWVFVLLTVLMTMALINPESKAADFTTSYVITGFGFALLLMFVKNNAIKYGLAFVIFLIAYSIKADRSVNFYLAFGVMLPTLVHVFLFTGLFIVYGALKSKSKSGIFSALFFIVCAFSFFAVDVPVFESLSTTVRENMKFFLEINKAFAHIFGMDVIKEYEDFFSNPAAVAIQRFVAFAYTYHYLNWFSKTTIIKWHEVSKSRLLLILSLWIISIVLYFIDYKLGFYALFFLSFLHVFFEFPLNLHTIVGIGKEVKNLKFK